MAISLVVAFNVTKATQWVMAGMQITGLTLIAALMILAVTLMRNSSGEKEKERKLMEVVEILDSPVPTRTYRTYTTPTPRTKRSVRRAGKTRLANVRRAMTSYYNPKTKNDCAYMCLLRAAKVVPSRANVRMLRAAVADRIHYLYINNMVVDECAHPKCGARIGTDSSSICGGCPRKPVG